MQKIKHLFFYFVLVFGLLAVPFVILEFAVPRLFPIPVLIYYHWANRPDTFYPDRSLTFADKDRAVVFRSNSLGFKDVEHSVPKPSGTFRVLLLGDSYVEAVAVPTEFQISQVMEKLARQRGWNMEVLSMGMSGWGQVHHLLTYEAVGKQFRPDLVITFFCGNDIRDNIQSRSCWLNNGKLVLRRPEPPLSSSLWDTVRHRLQRFKSYFVISAAGHAIYMMAFTSPEEKESAKRAALGVVNKPLHRGETRGGKNASYCWIAGRT